MGHNLPKNTKMAPVQGDYELGIPSGQIPWAIHELAHREYARQGHTQSAERIAERHGFSWPEIIMLLRGNYHLDFTPLLAELREIQTAPTASHKEGS